MPPDSQPEQSKKRSFAILPQTTMSSWGFSLTFHAVLILLLILLMPAVHRVRSAPGDRVTENVGIVFAPAASRQARTNQADMPQVASRSSVTDIVSQHIAELAPQRPTGPLPVIGQTSPTESPGAGESANAGQPGVGIVGDAVTGTFMGAQGTGRKFVYVLDRSSSTGYGNRRSPLFVAKNELLDSLQSIGDTGVRESKPIQFQVIFFNNKMAVFNTAGQGGSDQSGRLLRYDQATFDKLQRFLGGIIAEGGTFPEPALMQAVRMGADCVFFMTDGDTRLNPAQLQRIRETAKGVQINVVEYGMGPRQLRNNGLQELAADNNGNFIYVDLSRRPR